MRFFILNADYPGFLTKLYEDDPQLKDASFEQQRAVQNQQLFGVADFFPKALESLGHEAMEIDIHNGYAQRAWAREHDLKLHMPWPWPFYPKRGFLPWSAPWFAKTIQAQIEAFDPDVILSHSPMSIPCEFLQKWKKPGRLFVLQHAAFPLPTDLNVSCYDLLVSSFPPTLERFRNQGVKAEYFQLGFDPVVLDALGPSGHTMDVTFVGSLQPIHNSRIQWLEAICREIDVAVWSPDLARIAKSSPIHKCARGEAWGLKMYEILRDSKITLNHHGSVPAYANNMRLYEATGVGTMLITDWKQNLVEIFKPDVQVVAYRDVADCLEKIQYYLSHEDERSRIAKAGQQHTLTEHTFANRMSQLVKIINEHRGQI